MKRAAHLAAWLAAGSLVLGPVGAARAVDLTGNGAWSNAGIWAVTPGGTDAVPDNNDANFYNNVFLKNNRIVTLDGNYNFDQRYLYAGIHGGSGVLQAPAGTSATFAKGLLADGGVAGDSAIIYLRGGALNFTQDLRLTRGATASGAFIQATAGTLQTALLQLNEGTSAGNVMSADISGTALVQVANLVPPTAGTLGVTLSGQGRLVVPGDLTADPSLGGIVRPTYAVLGDTLAASFDGSRTTIRSQAAVPMTTYVYDYDNGQVAGGPHPGATLTGQDNWTRFAGADTLVRNDIALLPGFSGNGRFITTDRAISARVNDANFGYTIPQGTEHVRLEATMRADANGPWNFSALALAVDADSSGAINVNPENGFLFGLERVPSDAAFHWYVRQGGFGAERLSSTWNPPGGDATYRVVLDVDLTAYGGEGAGSMYVQQLAQGRMPVVDTLKAVPDMQNVPLRIFRMADPHPARWNAILTDSQDFGAMDNLTIRVAAPPQVPKFVYDFENGHVAGGAWPGVGLLGQDNWTRFETVPDMLVRNGMGVLPGLFNNTAVADGGRKIATRVNDANFSYDIPSGMKGLQLAFTLRMENPASYGAFGLGVDSDHDNTIDRNEAGFLFGREASDWYIRKATFGQEIRSATTPSSVEAEVWRLVLEVDLLANGGDGLGSLSVQHLSTGTNFASDLTLNPVAGLQNVPLGILSMSDADAGNWNGLVLDLYNYAAADNLQITFYVPEPASLALLALGGLLLAILARKRRRAAG